MHRSDFHSIALQEVEDKPVTQVLADQEPAVAPQVEVEGQVEPEVEVVAPEQTTAGAVELVEVVVEAQIMLAPAGAVAAMHTEYSTLRQRIPFPSQLVSEANPESQVPAATAL
ncbi:MAG: hypothetical protein WEB57_08135 [Pseudohongiellaceae bacterium]